MLREDFLKAVKHKLETLAEMWERSSELNHCNGHPCFKAQENLLITQLVFSKDVIYRSIFEAGVAKLCGF